jgi:sortase B
MGKMINEVSRKLDRFSGKFCVILTLMVFLIYASDRSYLVLPPQQTNRSILYSSGDKLGVGEILPGKIVSTPAANEVELVVEGEQEYVPVLDVAVASQLSVRTEFGNALSLNGDVVGYIFIPDSKISYPVFHRVGGENFYLKHASSGAKSTSGELYLDDNCNGMDDGIKLIHGHHMKNGTMFGQLAKYKQQSFADAHPYVYLFDGSDVRVYEVFAAVVVNAASETVPLGFSSLTEEIDYFNAVRDRSKMTPKEIKSYSDLLILNTCSYEAKNTRTLVYASRVPWNVDGSLVFDVNGG